MTASQRLPIQGTAAWIKLLAGLVAVFALMHASATALHSDRGQAGVLVCLAVVVALLLIEAVLFRRSPRDAIRELGFDRPAPIALGVAAIVAALLILVLPVFTHTTGIALPLMPGWLQLVPGLLAQGGIAEETLFRGYLFGRLRVGRPFWRAAWLSMVPFVGVHFILFATLPVPVAAAAVALAAVISFPLAHLFELGRGTIWAPALLHAVIQGAIKVVVIPEQATPALPLVWMAAAAGLPYLAFLIRRPTLELERSR